MRIETKIVLCRAAMTIMLVAWLLCAGHGAAMLAMAYLMRDVAAACRTVAGLDGVAALWVAGLYLVVWVWHFTLEIEASMLLPEGVDPEED